MSIIEKLWSGEIYAFEEIHPTTEKYREAIKDASRIGDLLGELLNDEGKALLSDYHEALMISGAELQRESYIAGVKLGANFILEVTDKESHKTDEKSE